MFNIQALISTFCLLALRFPQCIAPEVSKKWCKVSILRLLEKIDNLWQSFLCKSFALPETLTENKYKLFEAILIRKIYKARKQKLFIKVWADATFFNQFKFEACLVNGN